MSSTVFFFSLQDLHIYRMSGIEELDGKERNWKEKKDLSMFGKKNNKGFRGRLVQNKEWKENGMEWNGMKGWNGNGMCSFRHLFVLM